MNEVFCFEDWISPFLDLRVASPLQEHRGRNAYLLGVGRLGYSLSLAPNQSWKTLCALVS